MRVLWITHDVLEPFFSFVEGKPTKGGSWIAPLFFGLHRAENISLGILAPVINGEYIRKEIDNIIYYSINILRKDNTAYMNKKSGYKYLTVINDFKPDIIHVHGTENNFAMVRKYIDKKIPIVCSIQGIINSYNPYLEISIANIDISKYRSIKNRLGRGGISKWIKRWNNYSIIEKEIYKINDFYIGRTLWDKAQLYNLNPNAIYFHGNELLRPQFYEGKWDLDNCEKHRIFVSSAAYPIKGFHLLLKAICILKNKYPNIKIATPLSSFNLEKSKISDFLYAEDYANYLKSIVVKFGLENNIEVYGRLDAEEMTKQYEKAHVFVLPSYIENSPNSLGEAMMIGTPSIVSMVGGVMSIVEDENNALLFPLGDSALLAYQIDRLFSDNDLAVKLSYNIKRIAKRRHGIKKTVDQYIDIYKEILNLNNEGNSHTSRT